MTWPSIDSGEMRHLITINQQVSSSDASGDTVNMEPLYSGVSAKLKYVKGTDVLKSGRAEGEASDGVNWRPSNGGELLLAVPGKQPAAGCN